MPIGGVTVKILRGFSATNAFGFEFLSWVAMGYVLEMIQAQALYLCMGSACHQRRGYLLLPVLNELICQHGLGDRLLLKGAFCLENCQHGCSLKFGGRVLIGINEKNIVETFEREILPHCQPH